MRRVGTAWVVLLGGSVVLAWAGLRSSRYRAAWLESEPACVADGGCTGVDIGAALALLWWVVAAGGALVLVGVVLTLWWLPARRPAAAGRRWPAAVHALLAGLLASGVGWLLAVPVLVALFLGPHAWPAALAGAWLLQAGVVGGLHLVLGGPAVSPRRAWGTGLAAGAAGVAATLWAAVAVEAAFDHPAVLLLVDGGTVALVVLLARLLADDGVLGGAGPLARAVAGAAALVLAAVAVQAGAGFVRPPPPVSAPVDPAPVDPAPVDPAPPVPVPVAATPPRPVDAEVPCAQEDLDLTVTGFDAALGARAASVQARNTGEVPCWVEGVPVVTLLQGGRPLSLTVEPGQAPAGGPATVQRVGMRVGIAPGGTALSLLTWRTYAGWADAETPQTVTVALDPTAPPVEVGIVGGPPAAPFDIADGGSWGIAPWAPPW